MSNERIYTPPPSLKKNMEWRYCCQSLKVLSITRSAIFQYPVVLNISVILPLQYGSYFSSTIEIVLLILWERNPNNYRKFAFVDISANRTGWIRIICTTLIFIKSERSKIAKHGSLRKKSREGQEFGIVRSKALEGG